jgi:hypothetical protein
MHDKKSHGKVKVKVIKEIDKRTVELKDLNTKLTKVQTRDRKWTS